MEDKTTTRDARTTEALEARLRDAERRLFETEAKYTNLLEQLPAAIYIDSPDPDGPTYYVSPRIRELLGYTPAAYIARSGDWDQMVHPDDRDRIEADYLSFLETGQPEGGDYRYLHADGHVVWIHDQSKIVRDETDKVMFVQGVMFDITPQKEAELSMQHMAYHDTLTGLPNRAMFEEHLDLAVARARRYDRSVAVLFTDLDGFKDVNDSMGHAAGDELLCVVASRLREATRDTDLVARLGGDEFLVLLADLPDDRGASAHGVVDAVAERVGEAVGKPVIVGDRTVEITISVGSSVYPLEASDVAELMSRADAAMYAHKRRGAVARISG
ncbi:MAG: sensor domain-containing diguanylate cyclase [Actinomycetota bacterium]|nr:sensor domain-containing diguanylate cyclase [Actinomycetota bacterium]MDH5224089.1 sensor domain-containing diguanylate cyclase [Actinomycetota bacterium]MDH5313948.1 sensor domain-containing diguanylate cyclase [Actinomycetota bacterium]